MAAQLRLVQNAEPQPPASRCAPSGAPYAHASLIVSASFAYWAASCWLWHSVLTFPMAAWRAGTGTPPPDSRGLTKIS